VGQRGAARRQTDGGAMRGLIDRRMRAALPAAPDLPRPVIAVRPYLVVSGLLDRRGQRNGSF